MRSFASPRRRHAGSVKTLTINPWRPFRDRDLTVFVTNRKWRNFPHDDAGARDDFLGHITLTHQPAEIVSGSERFAQTIERFCPKRLEQLVRHQTHILEHAGAMPADYASIVRIGLADLEFLRHERKGLSRPRSLQAKTARFGALIPIKRARKVLLRANHG